MKRYYFSGIVRPERAQITFPELTLDLKDASNDDESSVIRLRIDINQLTAVVDSRSGDLDTLRNRVKHCANMVLSIVGFLKGYAYDVDIVKVVDENAEICRIFGVNIPVLEKRGTQLTDLNTTVARMLTLCSGNYGVYVNRCLTDLSLAMRHPDDTGFYCFRALEALKQYFADHLSLKPKDDEAHWKAMAHALGAKKGDDAIIRKYAAPARHGVPIKITDEERQKVFAYTWDLVERFIEYRLAREDISFRFRSE